CFRAIYFYRRKSVIIMCIVKGILYRETITISQHYDLTGLINPSFKVVGVSGVIIDGEQFAQGEIFVVNSPNIELSGFLQIQFLSDNPDERHILLQSTKIKTD